MDTTERAKKYAIPRGTRVREGIDAEQISELVDRFYADVRRDPELGPIFAERIGSDWEPHLHKMRGFWRTVLLAEPAYRGNPMAVHQQLKGLTPELFRRWLALFSNTVSEVFSPSAAAVILGKASRMARALSSASTGSACV